MNNVVIKCKKQSHFEFISQNDTTLSHLNPFFFINTRLNFGIIIVKQYKSNDVLTQVYLIMTLYSVLIIDDEPTFQRFLEFQLRNSERFRFTVSFASSAEIGITLLNDHHFDFILLDYYLPGMNGEMFLKQLNKTQIDTGIICISENKDYKIAVDLLKAGADDYISKSDLMSPYMLEKTIVSVLQKKEYRIKNSELEITAQRLDAIQTIIHTIDHELNNPLAIIKLCSDIINSSHPLRSDDYRELTQRILSSIERISEVIHRLNQFEEELPNTAVQGPRIFALPQSMAQ